MPLYFAHTTADHRHALFRIVHAATRMTCFHAGSTDGRCVARTFSRSGCCESGSKDGADHSIDWGLVKGRISTTGTCYVKASTDEMTPYITIPEHPYVFHAARACDGGHSFFCPPAAIRLVLHTQHTQTPPTTLPHACARAHTRSQRTPAISIGSIACTTLPPCAQRAPMHTCWCRRWHGYSTLMTALW